MWGTTASFPKTHHLPSRLTPCSGCLNSLRVRINLSPGTHSLLPGSPLSLHRHAPAHGCAPIPPPHAPLGSPSNPASKSFSRKPSPNPASLPETAHVLLAFVIIALQRRTLSQVVQWICLLGGGNAGTGPHFAALARLRVRAPDAPVWSANPYSTTPSPGPYTPTCKEQPAPPPKSRTVQLLPQFPRLGGPSLSRRSSRVLLRQAHPARSSSVSLLGWEPKSTATGITPAPALFTPLPPSSLGAQKVGPGPSRSLPRPQETLSNTRPGEHVFVTQSCLTLCNPMACSPWAQAPLSMGFSRQKYWSG